MNLIKHMRKVLLRQPQILLTLLASLLCLGCRSKETIPLRSPDFRTPVVTGIVITDEVGNELGIWGNPSEFGAPESTQPLSVRDVPRRPELASPYPNPTNIQLTIQYALPRSSHVKLWIVPAVLEGQEQEPLQFANASFAVPGGLAIRKMIDQVQPAGIHSVQWNTFDDNRQPAPAGFYRIYCQIDELLLWRDAFLFRDPCDLPLGLRNPTFAEKGCN
jgi:hypothetical protein